MNSQVPNTVHLLNTHTMDEDWSVICNIQRQIIH